MLKVKDVYTNGQISPELDLMVNKAEISSNDFGSVLRRVVSFGISWPISLIPSYMAKLTRKPWFSCKLYIN